MMVLSSEGKSPLRGYRGVVAGHRGCNAPFLPPTSQISHLWWLVSRVGEVVWTPLTVIFSSLGVADDFWSL